VVVDVAEPFCFFGEGFDDFVDGGVGHGAPSV
jgi:hypothetical protein